MYAAKWAQLKGASRVIGIDKVPERLAFAQDKLGIEVIDFSKYSDIPKRIYDLVPRGLDVALDCGRLWTRLLTINTHYLFLLRNLPRAEDRDAQSTKAHDARD